MTPPDLMPPNVARSRLTPRPSQQLRVRPQTLRRPILEGLESRALMAVSALDPGFGQGGAVFGPVSKSAIGASALVIQADGKLAAFGAFAYRPSGGGTDVVEPFGPANLGGAIPTPGDHDGDGKTDIAASLPSLGDFASRPSTGGIDVIEQFGIAGIGQTVPAGSIAADDLITTSPGIALVVMKEIEVPGTADLHPGTGAKRRTWRSI